MNKILGAIAVSIAIPSIAHAQAAQAPKLDRCEKHAGHEMTHKAHSTKSNN